MHKNLRRTVRTTTYANVLRRIGRERNTLDLIITSLPGQFVDIHSPDRLSDHDTVSGTLKVVIPPIKNLTGKYIDIRKVIMNL